eukprot:scaffold285394_cov32-Prasinocladus_malaysianus.AAC.1
MPTPDDSDEQEPVQRSAQAHCGSHFQSLGHLVDSLAKHNRCHQLRTSNTHIARIEASPFTSIHHSPQYEKGQTLAVASLRERSFFGAPTLMPEKVAAGAARVPTNCSIIALRSQGEL